MSIAQFYNRQAGIGLKRSVSRLHQDKELGRKRTMKARRERQKRFLAWFFGVIAATPGKHYGRHTMKVDHMFPALLFEMFVVWCTQHGYYLRTIFRNEDEFSEALEKAFRAYGLRWRTMESRNKYNLRIGPYKYKFSNFRLKTRGIRILLSTYDRCN
jgi:truncated hemoglobin YjbI